MQYEEYDLDQLGAHAYAHYKQGEKANQKANDHAKSAGLYLAEAKRRIDETAPYGERTKAWTTFLADHCPLKRRRAEQLIGIATGKTTVEEVRETNNEMQRRFRAKPSLALRNAKVHPPPVPPPEDPERSSLLAAIHAKLDHLSISQLHAIMRIIPDVT